MVKLITPDKKRHQYVVGIDFGHGETSAAICTLEWDTEAGQKEDKLEDIPVDRNRQKKAIPSAIALRDDDPEHPYIEDEAFEHISHNKGIRIGFKKPPVDIQGKDEKLMTDYMKAVYHNILQNEPRLNTNNHVVYIARPSGWQDEKTKDLYKTMALNAGIPLAGLTSESRAAIFYAKSPKISFAKEIDKGVIVFDLGSSTLDFTYLSDSDAALDEGYPLGASIIDKVIFDKIILQSEDAVNFVEEFDHKYEDALIYKARKFKETAYNKTSGSTIMDGFPLSQLIVNDTADIQAIQKYQRAYVPLILQNVDELNNLIEESTSYQKKLIDALLSFKHNYIKDKPLKGVFLTGGASRMNFIRPLIAATLRLPIEQVRIDKEPSLSVSRGIALLGTADAVTGLLVSKLKEDIPNLLSDSKLFNPLVEKLADNITDRAWDVVESTCNDWIKYGPGTDRDELKRKIESRMNSFASSNLKSIINNTLQSFIKDESESIRKEMNKIISRYAPGKEIKMNGSISIGNQDAIASSLKDMTAVINAINKSVGDIIADILWKALAAFLWGVFAIPYYVLKAIFTSDESKRKDKAKDILDKKYEIKTQVRDSLKSNLKYNSTFKNQVTTTLKGYFSELIDENLKRVMIPIE